MRVGVPSSSVLLSSLELSDTKVYEAYIRVPRQLKVPIELPDGTTTAVAYEPTRGLGHGPRPSQEATPWKDCRTSTVQPRPDSDRDCLICDIFGLDCLICFISGFDCLMCAISVRSRQSRTRPRAAWDTVRFLTPCTLRPAPFTLQPALFTLHTLPYILHPTPYTLHPTPYTLQTKPCTLHPGSASAQRGNHCKGRTLT
jgi:hypothetical protein